MKGGIVLMVHLLRTVKSKSNEKALNEIIVVLNDDEETGSSGSKEILKSLAAPVESVLIFEPGLPDGSLVDSHPGLDWIQMTVKGKASHAGLEPEKGLNACVELAGKILEIQKLNQYSDRLSVSPDVIQGGTTPNTICAEASVRIDARYPSVKDRNQVRKKLELISNHVFTATKERASGFTSTIKYEVSTDPMGPELTKELNEKAFGIARSLGLTLTAKPVGYLSDGNQIAALKKKLIVGVGPYGGGMHTDNEVLIPSSFAERSRWLTLLLESLLER
jgi:glutamate carboxypeptidase